MLRKPLAIPPRFLLIVLLICAAYWIVAARTEFSPLIPYSTFGQRVGECAALWTILCAGYIGVMMLRRRPCPENSRVWSTTLVPILAGLWGSALEVQQRWADLSDPLSGFVASWRTTVVIMMVVPLSMGAMGAGFLLILARAWRRIHRPGTCYGCGYDLRGNTSHRCPECGLQLGGDEDKIWVALRWCPELLLFETAAQRDAAWREAERLIRKCRGPLILYLVGFILGLPAVVLTEVEPFRDSAWLSFWFWCWLAAIVVAFAVISAANGLVVRLRRRALRQILLEQGIRVCFHCGQDLRDADDDMCPQCHRPSPPAIIPSPPAQLPQPAEKA